MKNSRQYADRVQKLYRRLKRDRPKVQQAYYEEPAESLVCGIISEHAAETTSQSVSKRFAEYYVDLNDLRVSRVEEIVDVLGEDTPATRDAAARLARVLMGVFNQYHKVSLLALRKIGKRPARQVLEKLDGITDFAVDYCMLTSLQAHAIPLTEKMIEYLKSNELAAPQADAQEIQGFLTRQIAAKDAYEFYALLRQESESFAASKAKTAEKKLEKAAKAAKKPAEQQ
jgi:endonuclease III